jgi:AbrB family looped-hinge helix DNA binding protein
MNQDNFITTMTDDGGIVIPAEYRKELGINVGDEVVMFLDRNELRIIPRQAAIKQAQAIVKEYAGNRSLSDELIEERRFVN